MEKSIRIHYKDGMITRYRYNTETFLKIAQGRDIIHYVEIEDKPLINKPNPKRSHK